MALLPCPVQTECGGCALMPLPLPLQREGKLDALRHLLRDNALPTPPVRFSSSPRAFGYRNRIRLGIQAGGVVRFFNPQKSPSCAVLEPGLRERLTTVLALAQAQPRLFAAFEHLELRSDDALGRPALVLASSRSSSAASVHATAALSASLPGFMVGVRGDPAIACQHRRVLDEVTAFVPLDAFLQINSDVNALLVAALRAGTLERKLTTVLDLYSGAGNFAIPLAAEGLAVCAVELHEPAMRALGAALSAQGLACERYAGSAQAVTTDLLQQKRGFELVIIDAPRSGAREVAGLAAQLASRSIAVCSCNPQTLVRDLCTLQSHGFELDQLHAFDMFPHTLHLEVLAWLVKR
jgi:23S rRNA (uracil1939-C5)-methyltransferase